MHLPDPTPDNHVDTSFEPDGDGTLMTVRMTLPDEPTRAAMLATGNGARHGSKLHPSRGALLGRAASKVCKEEFCDHISIHKSAAHRLDESGHG